MSPATMDKWCLQGQERQHIKEDEYDEDVAEAQLELEGQLESDARGANECPQQQARMPKAMRRWTSESQQAWGQPTKVG